MIDLRDLELPRDVDGVHRPGASVRRRARTRAGRSRARRSTSRIASTRLLTVISRIAAAGLDGREPERRRRSGRRLRLSAAGVELPAVELAPEIEVEATEDRLGVGRRRPRPAAPVAGRPGSAPALAGPTWRMPPTSTRAIEPPPAPIVWMSIAGSLIGTPNSMNHSVLQRQRDSGEEPRRQVLALEGDEGAEEGDEDRPVRVQPEPPRLDVVAELVDQDQQHEAGGELPAPDQRIAADRHEDGRELRSRESVLGARAEDHHDRAEQPSERLPPVRARMDRVVVARDLGRLHVLTVAPPRRRRGYDPARSTPRRPRRPPSSTAGRSA